MFFKPSNKSTLPTIISQDTQLTGLIISEEDVVIDGQMIGDVHALRLTVGRDASIHGKVFAEFIELHGHIVGDIVTRRIHMFANSRVKGDIVHEAIMIETGAMVNGSCQHQSFEMSKKPKTKAKNNILTHPSSTRAKKSS